jgi:hypothetical protein
MYYCSIWVLISDIDTTPPPGEKILRTALSEYSIVQQIMMDVNSSHCISSYFAMVGFIKVQADGGQPAVIRVRK